MFSERPKDWLRAGQRHSQGHGVGCRLQNHYLAKAWWHMTVITATQELGKEDYILRTYLGNLMKSCLNAKKKCKKRAGGVAQW